MPPIEQLDRSLKRRRENRWPSERFWDILPKIYLTHCALFENDRRIRLHDSERQTKEGIPLAHLQQGVLSKHDRAQLQRFARGGGPDLTDIRGCRNPVIRETTGRVSMGNTISGLTTSSKKSVVTNEEPAVANEEPALTSKKSGPYDANYELFLAQLGIFVALQTDENDDEIMPANLDEIVQRLSKPRPSLSPSRFTEQDFKNFRKQAQAEILESKTVEKLKAVVEGRGPKHTHTHTGSVFNNLEPFDPDLKTVVPDSYDGAPPLSIDHRVLHRLTGHIVPSTDTSRAAAPNFFLEVKGAGDVAQGQAAHNGAIGARGIMSLQSYPSPTPQYDNKAHTFTNTYHDGLLRMYTTHMRAPKTVGGQPQYFMTLINSFGMTGNSKTFREGATYYRNARDLAQEQRDLFIQQANQAVQTSKYSNRSESIMSTTSTHSSSRNQKCKSSPDTDTSLDELACDNPPFKRPRSTRPVGDNRDDSSTHSTTGGLQPPEILAGSRPVRSRRARRSQPANHAREARTPRTQCQIL